MEFVLDLGRWLDVGRHVADDLSCLERTPEGDPEDGMGIADGRFGEIAAKLQPVNHPGDVSWLKARERDAADCWGDISPDRFAVALRCPRTVPTCDARDEPILEPGRH
jgi:hypothetical protein